MKVIIDEIGYCKFTFKYEEKDRSVKSVTELLYPLSDSKISHYVEVLDTSISIFVHTQTLDMTEGNIVAVLKCLKQLRDYELILERIEKYDTLLFKLVWED